jgi:hypothetical protein
MADNVIPINPASPMPDRLPEVIPLHPAVRLVIDEQLQKLGEAIAIVSTSAFAIKQVYDCDSLDNPDIYRALKTAYKMINDAYGELVPEDLERKHLDPEVQSRLKVQEARNG